MPISPSQYIDALSKKIESIANRQKSETEKDSGRKIQVLILKDHANKELLDTSQQLKNLLVTLPARAASGEDIDEHTYQREIRIIMAVAYVKAYISERKRVLGLLGYTTAKSDYIDAYEEAITNALDTLKNVKNEDNFLLPEGNRANKGKFEKNFLMRINDIEVVDYIFNELLTSLHVATDWQGEMNHDINKPKIDMKVDICVNVMKVAVRLNKTAIDHWNGLVSAKLNNQALQFLCITMDSKTNLPQNLEENEIRNRIEQIFLKERSLLQTIRDNVQKQMADYAATHKRGGNLTSSPVNVSSAATASSANVNSPATSSTLLISSAMTAQPVAASSSNAPAIQRAKSPALGKSNTQNPPYTATVTLISTSDIPQAPAPLSVHAASPEVKTESPAEIPLAPSIEPPLAPPMAPPLAPALLVSNTNNDEAPSTSPSPTSSADGNPARNALLESIRNRKPLAATPQSAAATPAVKKATPKPPAPLSLSDEIAARLGKKFNTEQKGTPSPDGFEETPSTARKNSR